MAKIHVFHFSYGALYHDGEFIRLTEKRVVVKAPHNHRGEGFANREGALFVETDDPAATKAEFKRREDEFADRVHEATVALRLLKTEQRRHAMAGLKLAEVSDAK